MFGIEAPAVWLAYLFCLLSSLLCVVYGVINWNKGADPTEVKTEDKIWLEEEKEIEQEL